MAQITVVYKDFDEMKAVARELLKNELSDETRGQAKAVVPIQSTPSYTRDDLARAAMTLMDKGGMVQLQQLLTSYGCETLQQLTEDQFGSFATALRGMGAQI